MAIEIKRVDGGSRWRRRYLLRVTPPHADPSWATDEPISRRKGEKQLYRFGCHTADIAEAFAAADDEWEEKGAKVG